MKTAGDTGFAVIYVARHCKTDWNCEQRLQGKTNLPLSESGQREARRNGRDMTDLGIRHIASSDLQRAAQTAEVYADILEVPVQLAPGLRELDHGKWEGKRIPDLIADQTSGIADWMRDPQAVKIPEGARLSR